MFLKEWLTATGTIVAVLTLSGGFAPAQSGQPPRAEARAAARRSSSRIDVAQPVVLSNSHTRLTFEPRTMGLSEMADLRTGTNHIPAAAERRLLWEIAFTRGQGQPSRITNNSADCSQGLLDTFPDGTQRLTLEWKGLQMASERQALDVRVRIELPPDSGIALWRISAANRSDSWGLWSVTFPLLRGFPAPGQYDIARPVEAAGGELLKDCTARVSGRYPTDGWPMQFMSFNRREDGVFFGSRDPDGRLKDFVAVPGGHLGMVHYVEGMGVPGSDYPDYYPVELGVYRGGWVEAAHHYRSWALKQKWAQAGPLSQRSDISDVIAGIGLWVTEGWNWKPKPGQQPGGRGYITGRGWHEAPTDSNAPYLAAQKRMGVPMAMHWYHWHHNKFNYEYPHFLPARDGFAGRVGDLVKAGWLVMPYVNVKSINDDIPDFAEFAPHACTLPDGRPRATGPLVAMCPTLFWRRTISSLVRNVYESYGVNAIYLDQVTGAAGQMCFNPAHGHPVGGGHYGADGYRDLIRRVVEIASRSGRPPVVTGEDTSELYVDLMQAQLTWSEPSDLEIPLMQTVYSGYTLLFGSPCDYSRSDRFFRYAQGRALIDGRQNGWMAVGLFDPQHAAKADYLRQCARYRVAAKKYLAYGRLLRPIQPENPIATFEEEGFGWNVKRRGRVPSAEARLWLAEDGRLGLIMASYVDEAVPFEFSIDPSRYGLDGSHFELFEIGPGGAVRLGGAAGAIRRREVLIPGSLKLIEIAAARD